MLAETTDGNSRKQILELLGADSLDTLRSQAQALWHASYCNDGILTSILASSLWLDEEVDFKQDTLNNLAENYYASSFSGEMGSNEFNEALQSWINEQTGGLLENQASGLKMTPETLLALATTIYFKAEWSDQFSESLTKQDIFHTADGDVDCDFMCQSTGRNYYKGEQFSAVGLSLQRSGSMWLLLPEEGVDAEELLADSQVTEFLGQGAEWENREYLLVNLSIPKFDVASDLDLIPGLQELGITDVFDSSVSDFSPLAEGMKGVTLSEAKHAARVAVDEEGVTAAAYTVMMMNETAMMEPEKEVDFVLDRPFLFVITSQEGLPLFAGLVHTPN